MAPAVVLIDTSVVVDFLRKQNKQDSLLWRLRSQHVCHISVVTLFELEAGAKSAIQREDVRKIATHIPPVDLDARLLQGLQTIIGT